ncbi:MAG: energy transducer TonB [Ignavibacteriales bacterium]|nr:energy transducer TonB [Ignavibacteriales bacterium]
MNTVRLLFLATLSMSFLYSQEQKASPAQNEEEYFVTVEDLPEPIGGMAAIQANVIYPEIARRAGIQGTVYVEVFIDEKGDVVKASVKQGIGAGCDESAIEAIKKTKFRPGTQRGKPVKVRLAVPIRFILKKTSDGYHFNSEPKTLNGAELNQLLKFFQATIERFNYEIPFRHRLKYTFEEYEDGKQTDRKFASGSSTRQGGKSTFSILVQRLENNKVRFHLLGPHGSSTLNNISLKDYGATKITGLGDVWLKEHHKTPVFVYAMNPRPLDDAPAEGTFDYYLTKYKHVIALFLELQREE